MLSKFTEATANNTDLQTDEVLSEVAHYFKELADFVNESNVIINKTVNYITIIAIQYHDIIMLLRSL